MKITHAFEQDIFDNQPTTLRPKDVKIGIRHILDWEPSQDASHAIYKSSTPLTDRKKGSLINPLAHAEAKIQSLALMGSNSEGYSAVGGSETMDIYAFTYWQYTDSLVFWDGLVPTPDVIDAGHKNGVPVLGTLFFNWSTAESDRENVRYFLQQDEAGKYPVAHKLIEIATYYGFDGYFINQESAMPADQGYGEAFRRFLLYFKKQAAAEGRTLHISWYDSMDNDGSRVHHDAINGSNDLYVKPSETDGVHPTDAFFMNFNWEASKVKSTAARMNEIGRSPYDAYAGLELQAGGYYHTDQKKHALLDANGQIQVSLGLFIPDTVLGIADNGEDYHLEADKFWTGFDGNPATEEDEHTWSGLSRFVGDNTPLLKGQFNTNFNTGHGKYWFVDGEKRGHMPWNSRGIQDILPTWRWWIKNTQANIKGRFDFDAAYNGGTSLRFEGDLNEKGQSEIMLYSTELTIEPNTKLKLTTKENNPARIHIGLSREPNYDTESFTYYEVKSDGNWHTDSIDLTDLTGQTIYALKVRVTSEKAISDYQLHIGQLTLSRNEKPCTAPKKVEVLKSLLFNAQRAEALVKVEAVPETVSYEIYQEEKDTFTFMQASASPYIYLANLSRSVDAKGREHRLKVVALGENGVRSEPTFFTFDWGMEVSETTLPKPKPINIMPEARVTSEIKPGNTENPENILTGTINNNSDKWYASSRQALVDVAFEEPRTVLRWVVEHAGAGGESSDNGLMNTKDFNLEYKDMQTGEWKIAKEMRNRNEHITDVHLDKGITAQEWRLTILTADNGSPWGGIRIYNWKMYETVHKKSQNLPMATGQITQTHESSYAIALGKGQPDAHVTLYKDAHGTEKRAEGKVDTKGRIVFHQIPLDKEAGFVYYRAQEEGLEESHTLALPYRKESRSIQAVNLEKDETIVVNQAKPFDLSEHYLKLTYSDETSEYVRLSNLLVDVSPLHTDQEGRQELEVSYAGIASKLPLVVLNEPINFETKELAQIELSKKPKIRYLKGETLDLSDGWVRITYADGTQVAAALTDTELFTVSPIDTREIGEQLVTVTHRDLTLTFAVMIEEESINYQRLDQLIGKVEARKHQENYTEVDEGEKKTIESFLRLAKEKRTNAQMTQEEVDQLVAKYAELA